MISVLIPVYNEEEILERSAQRVHHYLLDREIEHEVVVVSNGSTDGTAEIGQRLDKSESWFRFFEITDQGVGYAFRKGVREAQYEYVVALDIDLPAELVFLDYARDLLQYADMVVGSKSMGDQRRSLLRVVGSQSYIFFAQLIFSIKASDFAPSTKAYRRSVILPVLDYLNPWTGFVFELCVYFSNQRKRVVQIGVDCIDHRKSSFNLMHEGFYRYYHLFRCFLLNRDRSSWYWTGGGDQS